MNIEKVISNSKKLISGPLVLSPHIRKDDRGFFYESWNHKEFKKLVDSDINFVQENESYSIQGVLRGMHYQLAPYAQGKLIKVVSGEIFDVIVDLREKSNTFLNWFGILINSQNKLQFWIPEGFAHGFLTLEKNTVVQYKVTDYWSKNHERCLIWDDKKIGISWPLEKLNCQKPKLSQKDLNAKNIQEILNSRDLF